MLGYSVFHSLADESSAEFGNSILAVWFDAVFAAASVITRIVT
jgi:hypothetical protein